MKNSGITRSVFTNIPLVLPVPGTEDLECKIKYYVHRPCCIRHPEFVFLGLYQILEVVLYFELSTRSRSSKPRNIQYDYSYLKKIQRLLNVRPVITLPEIVYK